MLVVSGMKYFSTFSPQTSSILISLSTGICCETSYASLMHQCSEVSPLFVFLVWYSLPLVSLHGANSRHMANAALLHPSPQSKQHHPSVGFAQVMPLVPAVPHFHLVICTQLPCKVTGSQRDTLLNAIKIQKQGKKINS